MAKNAHKLNIHYLNNSKNFIFIKANSHSKRHTLSSILTSFAVWLHELKHFYSFIVSYSTNSINNKWQPLCISYFYHHCCQISNRNNLWKKRFILIHGESGGTPLAWHIGNKWKGTYRKGPEQDTVPRTSPACALLLSVMPYLLPFATSQ
jgi:hypothetical protein